MLYIIVKEMFKLVNLVIKQTKNEIVRKAYLFYGLTSYKSDFIL